MFGIYSKKGKREEKINIRNERLGNRKRTGAGHPGGLQIHSSNHCHMKQTDNIFKQKGITRETFNFETLL